MGKIYWDLPEIPRPEGSYLNHADGRVYIMSRPVNGKKSRTVIGQAAGETMMHPNENFKYLYPALWQQYYPESNAQPQCLHAGMYTAALAAGHKTGLYPLLNEVFGTKWANALMDYACFLLLSGSEEPASFPETMDSQLSFASCPYPDTWWEEFFCKNLCGKQTDEFRTAWLTASKEHGASKAWIRLGEFALSPLSRKQQADGCGDVPPVRFLDAVSVPDGTYLTFFLSESGQSDSEAVLELTEMLSRAGIETEGVFAGDHFFSRELFESLRKRELSWILALPEKSFPHTAMMSRYAAEIRWNVRTCISDDAVFAARDEVPLFENDPEKMSVCLFFDGPKAGDLNRINRFRKTTAGIQKQLESGKIPVIPDEYKKYLSLKKEGNELTLVTDTLSWQEDFNAIGYSSMAVSSHLSAEETWQISRLWDSFRDPICTFADLPDSPVRNADSEQEIKNCSVPLLTAGILCRELTNACRRKQLDPNKLVSKLDQLTFVQTPEGIFPSSLSAYQRQLFLELDFHPETIFELAKQTGQRLADPDCVLYQTLPDAESVKPKRGRPPKAASSSKEPKPSRKPGRPKGSRNKKSLRDETNENQAHSE